MASERTYDCCKLYNFQLNHSIQAPGWTLGWTWAMKSSGSCLEHRQESRETLQICKERPPFL
ncbi:hypothetical protein IEQ34_007255 [Dendrobium chrysotoxum]|uniref:Uncharacterized protein n=1 Tax=Dendrobium chrysotoxum TaxID=161865 RepID=A0AAV7H8N0_DENCH|nr:hypothetical protein IEQ34_007255 [Dendrobium chrysotoxum]